MISTKVKVQLLVFTTLTIIAASLILFQYARVPSLAGVGETKVTARFIEGSGLYPFANVTYRGVTVGRVKNVSVAGDGVDVTMSIHSSAQVPQDVDATIKSVSAIGEQYVDLVPRGVGGRTLRSGDRIAKENTQVATPIATVLDDVDNLLTAVPKEDLATVLDEADKAFSGLGPDLATLTKNAQLLLRDADDNYEETHRLINDSEPFLDTQLTTDSEIKAWAEDLAGFTAELKSSDRQLRSVLSSIPGAAGQVEGLFGDLGETVPTLVDSSQVLADLAKDYHDAIQHLLVVFPLVAVANNAASGPAHGGLFGLAFKPIVNYPGGCSTGWPKAGEPLGPRGPNEIGDLPFPDDTYCKIAQDDPRVARGSRNLPCFEPGSPPGRRATTIYQCRGDGYSGTSGADRPNTVKLPGTELGDALLEMYGDDTSPSGDGPDSNEEGKSWQDLLMPR